MISADNLLFLLEVSRSGRVARAGQRLGVDETTVSRRVTKLEKSLGARLVDRGPTGWVLTDSGQRLLPFAEAVEAALHAASDTAAPQPRGLAGTVRLVAPDGFGVYVIAPHLGPLRSTHPDLTVEVMTATSHNLLTGRDFDIAVTLERPSPRGVSVRRLAHYDLKLYASRGYLDHAPPIRGPEDLHLHTLVWYVDALLDVEPLRILDSLMADARAHVQMNNIAGHHQAAVAGVGIAPLPHYVGDADPDLVTVLGDEFVIERTYWLVIPQSMTRLARVTAVRDTLLQTVDDHPHLRSATRT